MKKNKYLFIFIFFFLFKNVFIIPFHVSGGVAGVDEINYCPFFFEKFSCNDVDCFQYDLLVNRAIFEAAILLALFGIIIILKKYVKKNIESIKYILFPGK